MTQNEDWRQQVYDRYVSSGQAPAAQTGEQLFKSRAPYINWIIENHLPSDKSVRIVDLGCGHGTYLYFLGKHGYANVSGMDVSREQVEQAHQLGLTNVEQADLLPYLEQSPDASIDIFLMIDILEHLDRPTLFRVLNEVYRVLRPEGRLIGHVPNAAGIFGARVRYSDITHELAFTDRSIQQITRTVGFANVDVYEEAPLRYSAKSTIRRLLWDIGTVPFRLLNLAEMGSYHAILSSNLLFNAQKT